MKADSVLSFQRRTMTLLYFGSIAQVDASKSTFTLVRSPASDVVLVSVPVDSAACSKGSRYILTKDAHALNREGDVILVDAGMLHQDLDRELGDGNQFQNWHCLVSHSAQRRSALL